jgi:hypothetical protein
MYEYMDTQCVFIPIGLHCTAPWGVMKAGLRVKAYPFDWIWSPASATSKTLSLLVTQGADAAARYMTTGFEYYDFKGKGTFEHAVPAHTTRYQMNRQTGVGVCHNTINTEYIYKLKVRFGRFLDDVAAADTPVLIYGDTINSEWNYYLDGVCLDDTDVPAHLAAIHDLVRPLNRNLRILYFCRPDRRHTHIPQITYIPHDGPFGVENMIARYLGREYGSPTSQQP